MNIFHRFYVLCYKLCFSLFESENYKNNLLNNIKSAKQTHLKTIAYTTMIINSNYI